MTATVEAHKWMRYWGWNYTDGAMLKRDAAGVVIAHQGDPVWEADLDKACEKVTRLRAAPA